MAEILPTKEQLMERVLFLEQERYDVATSIDVVLNYIVESEMNGKVNESDSWYPTYESLNELLLKVEDEERDFQIYMETM
tara:strand:+ start:898 stop:1137 length:240 start_codon:yes stop_codon:yes gene_type:complete